MTEKHSIRIYDKRASANSKCSHAQISSLAELKDFLVQLGARQVAFVASTYLHGPTGGIISTDDAIPIESLSELQMSRLIEDQHGDGASTECYLEITC